MQLSHLSLLAPCYPPFKVTYFNSLITYLSQETRDKVPFSSSCSNLSMLSLDQDWCWHQCWLSDILVFDKSKAMSNVMHVNNDQCIHYRFHVTATQISVQSDRCLLSGRRARRQNSSHQLIKSFSRLICLGQPAFK